MNKYKLSLCYSFVTQIFFYSVIIFESAGLSKFDAKWANLGIGFINFAIVFCSPIIMAKINRRPVILLSTFFSGVFLVLATIVIELIVSITLVLLNFQSIKNYQIDLLNFI